MGSSAISRGQRASEESVEGRQWVVAAYRRYFRYIWAVLGRLGVPDSSIEDVVQEVFLVLHRRRHEFRNESSVRTWLHGIAIFTARRYRDRQRRLEQPPVDLLTRPEPPSPEAEAGKKQALVLVDRMLAELSDHQREVFVLADVAELSAPEISELLEIKLNTVYSRLRLARARMRQALDRLRANQEGRPHGTD